MNTKNFERPKYIIGDMVGYMLDPVDDLSKPDHEVIHIAEIVGIRGYVCKDTTNVNWYFTTHNQGMRDMIPFKNIIYFVRKKTRLEQ